MTRQDSAPRGRVLVVDDDGAILRSLDRGLRVSGFAVRLAPTGEDALARHAADPADLIVLDVSLPGASGIEVCARLRAAGDDVPVLMLSALDETADRIVGLQAGGDDYLVKPFALQELVLRLDALLRRRPPGQTVALGEMPRDHCSLYNGALQERRDAYRHASKTSVRYGDQSAQLKEIRSFDPERQGRWSFSSQQATLRRLDKAFQAFFRRVKAGRTPGYPRFKGVGHFDTVTFPKDGDGCRWDSTPHDARTRVRLQGVGHIRVHQHRPVRGRVKTISVKREGNRWYVVLSRDNVPAEDMPPTGAIVGIDMGVAHFLTTSDGEHVANPRFLQVMADELAEAQRHLATFPKRTRRRTKRHRSAARKVAKLHGKIRRQRADFHHKTARALVTDHDVMVHERLNTAGMTKSPAPKADPEQPGSFPPNGAAAKAGLNRGILDAGWAQFLGILANKAERAGRLTIPVDARNTSRTCPSRGHVAKENRATQAQFQCTACGYTANADHVGATNVLNRAGLTLCAAA